MTPLQQLLRIERPLVLASGSPRRTQLLSTIGLPHRVRLSTINEEDIHDPTLAPELYVQHLALSKARNVATAEAHNQTSDSVLPVVLGADTTVVIDGVILNKPESPHNAISMLQRLSGRTHTVHTGIACVCGSQEITAVESTLVTFRMLTEQEITLYVASGSPMDKAGAYGIQDDLGAIFVSSVQGCYYTIVGLPLTCLYTTLTTFLSLLPNTADL